MAGASKTSGSTGKAEGTRMTESDAKNLVEYACSNQVATLTLNRPDRLNAFNDDLVRQLRKREEFEQHGGPQGWGANSADLLTRSVNWKPVIAAPHGYAMGLALGIVLECDLIVAEAGTKFQVTETSRGLGGSKYWALLNFRGGAAFANEVALTGRFFTAEEAFAAGLINRVAPQGQHLEVAHELAAEVAKNPPLSVRAPVRTSRRSMEQLEREVIMQTAPLKLYLSEDFHEAARAFAEKRKPAPFKGR